jgi:hypothetical protein
MRGKLFVAALALCLPAPLFADELAPPGAPAAVDSLNLVCLGAGSATRATSMYGYGSGGWGQINGQKDVPFDNQVTLEIRGSVGRIRMPRSMLPPVRGGKDGWFEVKSVRWSENEITGTVQVNVLNSPKLRLDRLQGMLAIPRSRCQGIPLVRPSNIDQL